VITHIEAKCADDLSWVVMKCGLLVFVSDDAETIPPDADWYLARDGWKANCRDCHAANPELVRARQLEDSK
jgi:hypothetical protein